MNLIKIDECHNYLTGFSPGAIVTLRRYIEDHVNEVIKESKIIEDRDYKKGDTHEISKEHVRAAILLIDKKAKINIHIAEYALDIAVALFPYVVSWLYDEKAFKEDISQIRIFLVTAFIHFILLTIQITIKYLKGKQ